jgi:HSP20 family molecular chaperone IbpA
VEGAARQVRYTWDLGHEIDAAKSKAKLEHGVLTLTLAKLEPQSKAVTLSIE